MISFLYWSSLTIKVTTVKENDNLFDCSQLLRDILIYFPSGYHIFWLYWNYANRFQEQTVMLFRKLSAKLFLVFQKGIALKQTEQNRNFDRPINIFIW